MVVRSSGAPRSIVWSSMYIVMISFGEVGGVIVGVEYTTNRMSENGELCGRPESNAFGPFSTPPKWQLMIRLVQKSRVHLAMYRGKPTIVMSSSRRCCPTVLEARLCPWLECKA